MTLTTTGNIKPNINIFLQRCKDLEPFKEYLVVTSPDIKGFVTDGQDENDAIKNIIDLLGLFIEIGEVKDQEYNIILNYKEGIEVYE